MSKDMKQFISIMLWCTIFFSLLKLTANNKDPFIYVLIAAVVFALIGVIGEKIRRDFRKE